jgi:hypothetical protein
MQQVGRKHFQDATAELQIPPLRYAPPDFLWNLVALA